MKQLMQKRRQCSIGGREIDSYDEMVTAGCVECSARFDKANECCHNVSRKSNETGDDVPDGDAETRIDLEAKESGMAVRNSSSQFWGFPTRILQKSQQNKKV